MMNEETFRAYTNLKDAIAAAEQSDDPDFTLSHIDRDRLNQVAIAADAFAKMQHISRNPQMYAAPAPVQALDCTEDGIFFADDGCTVFERRIDAARRADERRAAA